MEAVSSSEREGRFRNEVLERAAAPRGSSLPLPRLLLVFAHPDDEVLAVGGRLERMARSRLVTITDGAPGDGGDASQHGFGCLAAYRRAREQELMEALGLGGLGREVVVPFPERVADQGAGFHLAALARALAKVMKQWQPEAVVTHPYEGGHPDHDACAFAAHAAVRLLHARAPVAGRPIIVEAPFYNAGEDGAMRTGVFLPANGTLPVAQELSGAESTAKKARLACFRSQAETLRQFGTERESYRVAPAYVFTEPPHEGQLFYEQFSWGMTGARFRELAGEALRELFPGDEGGTARAVASGCAGA